MIGSGRRRAIGSLSGRGSAGIRPRRPPRPPGAALAKLRAGPDGAPLDPTHGEGERPPWLGAGLSGCGVGFEGPRCSFCRVRCRGRCR